MFCLVTDLMDWEDYPGPELAALYRWRWDGSETALREAKAPLRGACLGTGPMLRSCSPALVRQELAAWAVSTGLARGVTLDAALAAAPFARGRGGERGVKGDAAGQPGETAQAASSCRTRAGEQERSIGPVPGPGRAAAPWPPAARSPTCPTATGRARRARGRGSPPSPSGR